MSKSVKNSSSSQHRHHHSSLNGWEKQELSIRWVVLLLSCVMMIGNYYCFDNPAALKSQLQSKFHAIPTEEYEFLFSMLYTIYSIPNIVLPLLGGILVDRIGVQTMLLTFSALILLGQLVFALGCSTENFTIMLIGRLIFGFGGENLGVAQSKLVSSWFQSNELAFALGINLSIARLGSVINNEVSPHISHNSGVTYALWFGVFVCALSLLAAAIVVPIDMKADSDMRDHQSKNYFSLVDAQSKKSTSIFGNLRRFGASFWLLSLSCLVVYGCVLPFNNVSSSLIMERDYFKEPPVECRRCGLGAYAGIESCTHLAPHCPPVPPFAWPLPQLSSTCNISEPLDQLNCTSTPPYITDGEIQCEDRAWKNGPFTSVYCKKKADAESNAATPMSVPYVISALLAPFLGLLVDRIGFRAGLALLAPLVLTIVHVLLAWSSMSVWFPLILQGIAYSVFAAALWPSVPYVVEASLVGSAYGTITSIQNAGLALFPLMVAAVYDIHDKYIPSVELLFAFFGLLGTFVGLLLNYVDHRNGSILNGRSNHQKNRSQHSMLNDVDNIDESSSDSLLTRIDEDGFMNKK